MTEPLAGLADETACSAELATKALALCKRQWCVHLLYALAEGPRRFNELGRAFIGLSGKVMTETLHSLEHDRLIRRDPAGAYELTPLGRSLLEPLAQLADWAARHRDELSHRVPSEQ